MKTLKKILIGLGILIAIPLVVALFLKKEYTVSREITVNKPVATVFDYIKHLKNQKEYSIWVQADPNLKQQFKGTDGTVGFVNSWQGNDKAGEGEQEITAVKENERVDMQIRFKEPFESTMQAAIITQEVTPAHTKVTWTTTGKNPYPTNFMCLFMDDMLGKDLEANLANLKTILEKQ